MQKPTLDAHCHIASGRAQKDLRGVGAALAMTISLDESAQVIERADPNVAWGAGCHPRFPHAQTSFDIERFSSMLDKTAIIGEIGLDGGSRVPMQLQLKNFRQILEIASERPRLISIHSYGATDLVLQELRARPVSMPILHWWTGSAEETSQAVELGCRFSIHSAIARHSKFRRYVPAACILVESDHGYNDPPAAIPCRIEWVEHLVAQQYRMDVREVRELVWQNLATLIKRTGTEALLPALFTSGNY